MAIEPASIDIPDVVEMVWATTLDLPLERCEAEGDAARWSEPAIEAQVHITGDWQGSVVLHATAPLVRLIAQRMFRLGDQPPAHDDMCDAFGELANITGGNIKGMVSDGGAELSLPMVVDSSRADAPHPDGRCVSRCVFLCDGHPLAVMLLEAETPRT